MLMMPLTTVSMSDSQIRSECVHPTRTLFITFEEEESPLKIRTDKSHNMTINRGVIGLVDDAFADCLHER